MKFSEYRNLASRTGGKDLLPENKEKGLNCAAMGMCGESGELSEAIIDIVSRSGDPSEDHKGNLKKESGDVLWYIAHACNVMGWAMIDDFSFDEMQNSDIAKISDYNIANLTTAAIELSASCGSFIDVVKKIQHHRIDMTKDLESKMKVMAVRSVMILARISNIMYWNFSDVANANIEKLRKRYPSGFTTEDSLKRADLS